MIKLNYKGDLIYQDGPILSHYIDDENNHYLIRYFSDGIELTFKVTNENLLDFFYCKLSILNLLELSDVIYFNGSIYEFSDIPVDYLPGDKSFFNENHYEEYSISLKRTLILDIYIN